MADPITVLVERCVMQINLDPFFSSCTIAKAKKLFGYVFQEPWRNEDTITALADYLPQKADNAKELWHQASAAYQNGYVDTTYRYDLTDKQKSPIKAQNKRLLNEVKHCKTQYERWVKIVKILNELKEIK